MFSFLCIPLFNIKLKVALIGAVCSDFFARDLILADLITFVIFN